MIFDVENKRRISGFDLDYGNTGGLSFEFESWSNDGSLVQVCWFAGSRGRWSADPDRVNFCLQLMDPYTGSVALEVQSRYVGAFAPNSQRFATIQMLASGALCCVAPVRPQLVGGMQ
ncbi:hypothetical protein WJX73_008020 [Symbiochloris irregularis]|uniref:Uncharacterized protein n=1 Tax=Symbiochloris irregularis TaxID=706552 RepID=A0AAW1P2S5_9CHLO